MKKKLLSLLMATAMILSLAVPAFAASGSIWYQEESESNNAEQKVTMPSKMFIPTVKLTMPKIDGEPFVLNPYKIAFDTSAGTNKVNNVGVTLAPDGAKQIICPIYDIKSLTNADMTFSVNVKATVAGALTLTPNPVPITATQPATNQAHMLFVYTKNSTATAPAVTATDAITDLDEYDTANNDALTLVAGEAGVTTAATTSTLLKAAGADASGNPVAEYLSFQIKGDMTRNPKTAWKEADKVTGVITFTFTPISKPDYTGTRSATAAVAYLDSGVSSDVTFELPVVKSDMTIDAKGLSAVPTSIAGPNFSIKAGADAAYTVINPGALNPTVTAEGGVTITADTLKTLPKTGSAANYKFTVAFADKNGVPRTLEVTVPINRASS